MRILLKKSIKFWLLKSNNNNASVLYQPDLLNISLSLTMQVGLPNIYKELNNIPLTNFKYGIFGFLSTYLYVRVLSEYIRGEDIIVVNGVHYPLSFPKSMSVIKKQKLISFYWSEELILSPFLRTCPVTILSMNIDGIVTNVFWEEDGDFSEGLENSLSFEVLTSNNVTFTIPYQDLDFNFNLKYKDYEKLFVLNESRKSSV